MAKLPNGDKAVVDMGKLVNYCLNPDHVDPRTGQAKGRAKARLWSSMLGITVEHASLVAEKLKEVAATAEATHHFTDQYGVRYETRFVMTGPNGQTKEVKAGWIIDTGNENPRLSTCFPEADKK